MKRLFKLLHDHPKLFSRIGVVGIVVAGMVLSSCYRPDATSISQVSPTVEPVAATETLEPTEIPTFTPTETATPTEVPTETPTPTEIPTETAVPTSTPTVSLIPWGADRKRLPTEQDEIFGYSILTNTKFIRDLGHRVPGVEIGLTDVVFDGIKSDSDGDFFVGTFDFRGEEITIEVKMNYYHNTRVVYRGRELFTSIDSLEKAKSVFVEGQNYLQMDMFWIDVETGMPISFPDMFHYTEEDWAEIRDEIEELFLDGGRNSKYYLSLFAVISH